MNAQVKEHISAPIAEETLLRALNELSRSVNISTTYGKKHPAAIAAVDATLNTLNTVFHKHPKVSIGANNGNLTVNGTPSHAIGTLMIALERRLARLRITGLRISKGITKEELSELITMLAVKDGTEFKSRISGANLSHIASEEKEYVAIAEDEAVANKHLIGGLGSDGILVLNDEPVPPEQKEIHVDQIIAFLDGSAGNKEVDAAINEIASDPAKLANLIMESVSIRQSMNEFSGESLGDIVLGCLRKTYDALRHKPQFNSEKGKADLQKSLLMLEESLLIKLRTLTKDNDPELDREIIQAIKGMNDELGFEVSAMNYSRNLRELEKNKDSMVKYARNHGDEAAESLIQESEVSPQQWQKIVIENAEAQNQPVASGLETLTTVFEKLETVIRSTELHDGQVKDLLGKANDNLDDTIDTTKEKLELLSRQLQIAKAGTIGGQGRNMDQRELLAALAEVAQELMQPITAITASLEMMLHGFVGDITEEQRDLLEVAGNSSEHLKYLMKELIDIVGCPTNKGVDERFHTTSEEIAQLKDVEGQEHLNLGYFQ